MRYSSARSGPAAYVRGVLTPGEIDRFVTDGFVVVRGAVPRRTVEACWADVCHQVRRGGVDPDRPDTWQSPVVRVVSPHSAAFVDAGGRPELRAVYDQLLGEGTWLPQSGVGGTIPVRFPVPGDPGDAGWHVDAGFAMGATLGLDVHARDRGLVCLFLLTDVGPDDAPTELKVGSHADVPAVLAPYGSAGVDFLTVARSLPPAVFDRPSVFATGVAGDVFVCHPFLVHRATWPHRGRRPRGVVQSGVATKRPFALDRHSVPVSPVELAILGALAAADSAA